MKKITLLLTLLFLAGAAFSQYRVTGSVSDSSRKALLQVNLQIKSGGKAVYSTTSGESGAFSFGAVAAGSYILEVSAAGFQNYSEPLQIATGSGEKALEPILLAADRKELSTVVVTAQQQKSLVEDKGDRLVYNASADISNAGGTAADVLRKVPTLTVDLDGNVQMRGNGNIKVLINGKPSALMARNLADALRQMPANIIKTVEVITSPGAKYDAEGSAGVINIITKRGLRGFNGSLNATAGDRNRSIGTSLSLRRKKLGLNFSGNVYQYRNVSEYSAVRTTLQNGLPDRILHTGTNADNTGTGAYSELAVDYDPDSINHINLSVNIWGGDFPNNSTANIRLTDGAGNVLENYRNESHFTNPYGNGQIDLGWTRSFKKPGQEFSLLSQFSRMPDNYFYNTDRFAGTGLLYREESENYSRNKEYTFQADYTHPFKIKGRMDTSTLKLELGSKAIIRNIGSEVRVKTSPNGHEVLTSDPSQNNDFEYKQRVYSGYSSLRWSNKKRWNINAGLRLEHTVIDGAFITSNSSISQEYDNLIPSALISKGMGKHSLKVSYTQRITRPQIWYLNPWINRTNPKSLVTGTPALRPELNHATELSHSYTTPKGFSLNTAFYWRQTDNAIEYVSRIDSTGAYVSGADSGNVTVSRPLNVARRAVLGVNMNVSAKPNKNWSVNGGGDLRHVDINSPATGQRSEGWTWNFNTNTSYKLPGNYTLQGYAGVYSGWIGLQNRNNTVGYWYGLSAKKTFWKDAGSLTFASNMPFTRGIRQRSEERGIGFYAESQNLWVNRSFRLTFEWRFGQMSSEGGKQGKKIANDDSGR
ncbi:outer membrane beta-barrel family protein [Flaviaesturariibacter aridisoli]|uniref:TonB-dependent receptor n=1 Tax=Flaviaesturariibacter aridisoli TaxID=2545761 RepID=A0A4R4E3M4_9BACT|nr:outer membrane beta-barrel family protein [Flaviaesturariibacter aridisoli]TCZ70620.1 TonB-dependent receptor [Flaviaesturariibacter aridisoli]